METGYEVGILLFLDYLLKLEREPETNLRHNQGGSISHEVLTLARSPPCPSRQHL